MSKRPEGLTASTHSRGPSNAAAAPGSHARGGSQGGVGHSRQPSSPGGSANSNKEDMLHLILKKTAASLPDNKFAQALYVSSQALPFGGKGNRKRLEELVIVLYLGYAPYTPAIPECKCTPGGKDVECSLQVMKAFLINGGKEIVEWLLLNAPEENIEWAMKIAWRLHICRSVIGKCRGDVSEAPLMGGMGSDLDKSQTTKKAAKKEYKTIPKELDWETWSIPVLLRRESMGEKAISAMFEILVGDIRMPKKVRAEIYMAPINEFQIIPILFGRFKNLTGAAAKLALENMNVILMNSRTNLEILFRQPKWQSWFVPFLLTKETDVIVDKRQGGLAPDLESSIFKFAVNLMTMLHYHCFKSKKKGFRNLLKDTKSALVDSQGWVEETCAVYRVLLFTLIKRVQNDAVAFQTDYTVPAWDNLLKLFDILEQFIFYEPLEKNKKGGGEKRKLGLHLYDDGTCQDLIVVIDVIDLLDSKFDLNYLNPKFNSQVAGNQKLVELGSQLIKERDFFRNVRQFFLSLEQATGHDMILKNLSALLQSRKTGKIDSLFGKMGKSTAVEKQLAVAVEEQKTMISSTKDANVQVSQLNEEAILAQAKRGFKSASAAQRFCMEKRQVALMENPLLSNPRKSKMANKNAQKRHAAKTKKKKKKKDKAEKVVDPNKVNVWDYLNPGQPNQESSEDDAEEDGDGSGDETVLDEEKFEDQAKSALGPGLDKTMSIMNMSSEMPINDKAPLSPVEPAVPAVLVQEQKLTEAEQASATKWAISSFDFEAEASNEISLREGMLVEVLQEKESGWWLVTRENKIGFAPSNYLELIPESKAKEIMEQERKKAQEAAAAAAAAAAEEEQKAPPTPVASEPISPSAPVEEKKSEYKAEDVPKPEVASVVIEKFQEDRADSSDEEAEHAVADIGDVEAVREQIIQVTVQNMAPEEFEVFEEKKEPQRPDKIEVDESHVVAPPTPIEDVPAIPSPVPAPQPEPSKQHIPEPTPAKPEPIPAKVEPSKPVEAPKPVPVSKPVEKPVEKKVAAEAPKPAAAPRVEEKKQAPIEKPKPVEKNIEQKISLDAAGPPKQLSVAIAENKEEVEDIAEKIFCGYCKKELDPEEFYELEGVICCKEDLLKNFLKCLSCGQHISGEHLTLPAGRLHLRCATCSVCHKTFANPAEIQQKQGNLYCKQHFDDLFGVKCAHCKKVIDGQYLVALGKTWHFDHFVCAGGCEKPLQGEYLVHDDKPYCLTDYKRVVAKKCAVCSESVLSTALSVGDLVYHSSCVKCDMCGSAYSMGSTFLPEPLQGGEKINRFLCSKDYREKYLKPCTKCGLLIEANEERAFGDGKWWHSHCLKCDECGKMLIGEEQFFKGNTMLCKDDFEKLALPKCGLCSLALKGKFVSLLEMKCHQECVRCSVCNQALVGSNLGIRQSTKNPGKLLCNEHFAAENGKVCFGCKQVISKGPMLNVKDRTFHPDCLSCEICKVNLKGQKFAWVNDKLRCAEHVRT
jgi:hypothetical protein